MHHLKSCSKCHEFKKLADFDHSRASRDNRHHRCKGCDRRRDKERARNGSLKRTFQGWIARNPLAAAAHRIFQRAIKRGDITRQPCASCGKPNAHGHHPDYSKPLHVEWLCRACHTEHHRRERFYGHGQSLFSFIMEGGL
jgi:hypothetical protein